MMNVMPRPKMIRNLPTSATGFPMLEELCIATSSMSFFTDQDLNSLLHGSPRLRVLDLRGCSRVTPIALSALPCEGDPKYISHCCTAVCLEPKCRVFIRLSVIEVVCLDRILSIIRNVNKIQIHTYKNSFTLHLK